MHKILVTALALACSAGVQAQTIPISPQLFGINYWYYDYATGASSSDAFLSHKSDLQSAGIGFVRLGGNAPNKRLGSSAAILAPFDNAIDNVRAAGMTPMVQLSMNLAAADIPVWVSHFHDAKQITYWDIGNEPDPSSHPVEWYTGALVNGNTVTENGNTYQQFRDKFVALATAVKQADPNAIVAGPDFRQFWGNTGANEPLGSYYPAFINDVGSLTVNGVPLLDVFTFHFYGNHSNSENVKRTSRVQSLLDAVNKTRSRPLRMAVGEVNGVANSATSAYGTQPYTFEAGQFLMVMMKNVASNGGAWVAPWSISESGGNKGATDFSTFNANGSQRSTMAHIALMANNRRAFLMPATTADSAYVDKVVPFAMTDATGSSVMLMNTSTAPVTYAARLDGRSPDADAAVRFQFSSTGLVPAQWSGTLPAKTTYLFTLDGQGRRLAKYDYNSSIAAAAATDDRNVPLVTDLQVSASATGESNMIALAAASALPRSRVDFYVDGALAGSDTTAPFGIAFDSFTVANGAHTLVAKAWDADGNVDASPPQQFTVQNPLNVSAQIGTSIGALVYNRSTRTFNGRITLVNRGATAIDGPLQVQLSGLPSGIVLDNASGTVRGAPYVTLGVGLPPGASATANLAFSNPDKQAVTYTPVTYSGYF